MSLLMSLLLFTLLNMNVSLAQESVQMDDALQFRSMLANQTEESPETDNPVETDPGKPVSDLPLRRSPDDDDLWEDEAQFDLEEEEEEEEEEGTEEEKAAAEEALADAIDDALPEVIVDEVPKSVEAPRYAKILEIDQNATRKRVHDGDYYHPFHQPNIVDDVFFTYRRFRKMKLIRHGKFWMGTNDPRSETGEYPIREIPVRSFYLDIFPVINAFYWAFRAKKRFARSEAEVKGWSWVTESVVSPETKEKYSTEGPLGWLAVKKARWDKPEGPDSDLEDRWTHPVVHLSWYDAKRYCEFHGKRLPTEQEWEYAARAGLVAEEYPWGDRWEKRRSNTWQGRWPYLNSEADGYKATAPVDAYAPQNIIGLYDLIGNVWEWTFSRYYERLISRDIQGVMHVLKGGSFVDTVDGRANLPVRNGQRSGQAPDYTSSNIGFRCARSAPEVDPKFKDRKVKARKTREEPAKRKVPKIYRRPKPHKDEL
ncbi:inactive C-alpha-formylglycine-generating enzyme 2-like [Babylonia areolata]|uniref:inactive C-alpha-formylglycine-generating enzyme 2-like n=1 Tax=Babylonia areolata TaxID=304850 RepID=UPI003FCF4502